MGEHGPGLRHHVVHGPPLRTALHALPPITVLHRTAELDRMAGRAPDQYTRYVSEAPPPYSIQSYPILSNPYHLVPFHNHI